MANDPICGMYVDEKHSHLESTKNGLHYYFCSPSCKIQFEKPEKEMREMKKELAIAWSLSAIILAINYVFLSSFAYSKILMLALASIVQFYPGLRFYKGAYAAIKNLSSNMDTLISIGTSAAWAFSTAIVLAPHIFPASGLYFDTSALIISLILTGTYLQRISESRAGDAIKRLAELKPKTAHIIKNKKIIDIDSEEIKKGDILLVKPGEKIPTDSIIIYGETSVDESMITGESMPANKTVNDKVIGGTINLSGAIRIKAEKVGNETVLADIIKTVEGALQGRIPVQQLVDRISSVFVPIVVLAAIVSSSAWYVLGAPAMTSVLIFISVLIIACPCALGIATPAALLVSSGVAAKEGILVKKGEAIEASNKIDTIIFDKTGTLTTGNLRVARIEAFGRYNKRTLLQLAASAESNSEHPIGKAIISAAKSMKVEIEFPKKFKYLQGYGVVAEYKGKLISVGSERVFKKISTGIRSRKNSLENSGKTVLYLGINGEAVGIIALEDDIRKDAKKTIEMLNKMGIEPWIISGDNEIAVKNVAAYIGIKNILANAKPKDKMEKISQLQASGKKVAVVGDGINDAPALAKADLGIAIGSGTDVAKETGSIVLIGNSIYNVAAAIQIGRKTMSKIKQNLAWAFGYNAILIPVAAGALIPIFGFSIYSTLPILSAVAMAFSSVTVVSNSLLLNMFKSKKD